MTHRLISGRRWLVASGDFSHVIFESRSSLLAETAALDPTQPKLYEWVDGTTHLIGMVPTAPDQQCGGAGPACVPSVSQAGRGALLTKAYPSGTISEDGRRVIFTVADPAIERGGQLYLRDDQGTPTLVDDTTVHVNASERAVPEAPASATFWAASSDGSKVFFTTAEKLTDEDPNSSDDLYRYDLNAPAGSRLTRISVDSEPGDNQGNDLANGHNVAGALGASQDGDTVYFANKDGQLVAGGSTSPPVGDGGARGNARIYRWHTGTLHEVGGVNDGGELTQLLGRVGWGFAPKLSRVSPDGRHLAFLTQGTDQLLSHYGKPEYDHGSACSPFGALTACLEAYVYNADANGGAGDLQCASCNPTGTPAHADATFFVHLRASATKDTSHLNHPLSDDGRYVFFSSGDDLLEEDTNGVTDAYQYNTETEQVSLLSSGTSTTRSIFLDASADGSDAFILTRSQLSPADHDQSNDLYDVRVGGGSRRHRRSSTATRSAPAPAPARRAPAGSRPQLPDRRHQRHRQPRPPRRPPTKAQETHQAQTQPARQAPPQPGWQVKRMVAGFEQRPSQPLSRSAPPPSFRTSRLSAGPEEELDNRG